MRCQYRNPIAVLRKRSPSELRWIYERVNNNNNKNRNESRIYGSNEDHKLAWRLSARRLAATRLSGRPLQQILGK